jgi:multicomponent Na+:H+ antiporter subunit B
MNTLILRTVAPPLTALMLLFSVFVLLRGHNEPGGGFIGGLIAASALAIYGIAFGVGAVRRAIRFHPMAIAGAGLFVSTVAGLISILFRVPFMTGLWIYPHILGTEVPLSTVMAFDIGVYLVVLGAIVSIALALEQDSESPEPVVAPPAPPVPEQKRRAARKREGEGR